MLTWLGAACLAAGMAATVPLSGTVVDAEGHPMAGASVWLGDTHADHKGPQTIATAETDDEGRFRLERPDDLPARGANSWSPTLWTHKPGFRVGHLELKWGPPKADEPVRLTLGPPAAPIAIRVVRLDGSPVAGARVRPIPVNLGIPRPPDEMLDRLTATTDADGLAKLNGFAPAEVPWFDVTVGDDLVQCLMPRAGSRTVALRPLGRLSVRLVADDPGASLKGWKITVTSRPPEANYQGPSIHWRRETTGDDGRIDFKPMAEGALTWKIEPPDNSDYVVSKQPTARLRAGETTEAEIQIQRGVRVEGIVREEPGGAPIPGVGVGIDQFGQSFAQPEHKTKTDAQGRFSIAVLPGTCRFQYSHQGGIPNNYFLPPGVQHWADFETKEGEERHEFTPPPLREAALVVGKVIGPDGEPEAGASVSGPWTSTEYEQGGDSSRAETNAQGEFVLGHIPPGARLQVWASRWLTHDSEGVVVPKAGEGEPITIHLRKKPTRALSGRVLDADDQPLADALIRVNVRQPKQPPFAGESVFGFGEGVEIRTDADGRYATPREIPADLVCRVEATADGWDAGSTDWLPAAETDAEAPDLRLRKATGVRELAGRVVDSFGNPVAGAEVFRALDEPTWDRSKTDADGRFTLVNVPNAPALVFASKEGYRFLGQRVEPGERSVDLVLRSFAEPPPAPLRPVPSPVSRELERAIARELIAAARETPMEGGNSWPATALDEIEAWVDPDRVVAMIENQAREPRTNLLVAVAVGRSEGDPAAILRFLDAIGEPSTAAGVALGIFDRLGSAIRPDFRRELLDRAERSARELQAPTSPAHLFLGIGERRLDLGDADRGAALVREAQKLMDQGGPDRFPSARDGLIKALARVDLSESLKMLGAREGQRYEIDHLRAEIAKRIAPSNLDEARRLLDAIEERDPVTGRRAVRLLLAKTDLEAARALGNGWADPLTDALLPAVAAKAKAATDPAAARELLRESVERLSKLESFRPGEPPTAVMLARLLPLAARIDPDRAPSYLWLALARRPTAPESMDVPLAVRPSPWTLLPQYLGLAELAALVARYDREAAEVALAPVAARFGDRAADQSWGLGNEGVAAFAAAGAFDARAAKALVDGLPDDPPPPKPGEPGFHRNDKLQSRIAVARILGLPRVLRFREPFQTPQTPNDWVEAIED